MGTCFSRDNEASFALVFDEKGQEYKKEFKVDLPDTMNKENFNAVLNERIHAMDLPDQIKRAMRTNEYAVNGVPVRQYIFIPEQLRKHKINVIHVAAEA